MAAILEHPMQEKILRHRGCGPAHPRAFLAPSSRNPRYVRTNLSSREGEAFLNCRMGIEGTAKHAGDLHHVELANTVLCWSVSGPPPGVTAPDPLWPMALNFHAPRIHFRLPTW